jgi:hypothetical protein
MFVLFQNQLGRVMNASGGPLPPIPLDRVMAQQFTKGNFVSMTLNTIALVLVISGAVVGLAAGFIAVLYRN